MELLNLITFYYINSLSYFIAFRFLLCLDHIRILHVVFKELIGIDLQHLKHAQPAKLYSLFVLVQLRSDDSSSSSVRFSPLFLVLNKF